MKMSADRTLWQSVVLKALMDATQKEPTQTQDIVAKRQAHEWLLAAKRDFRLVCHYADLDPDFISQKYRAGQIDAMMLRRSYTGAAR
jgi:hypothetical protein